jgi:hypothetical protein
VWTSRDTADHPPIGLRGGIGTQQVDVFRLTPYLQPALARARCAMSRAVDAPTFLINATEKTIGSCALTASAFLNLAGAPV